LSHVTVFNEGKLMDAITQHLDDRQSPELTARLDRLTVWPYSTAVIWVVGAGYFLSFFDITNVAFGLPVFAKIFHMTAAQTAYPISFSLFGYILGSWLNGNLSDYSGRKVGIIMATVFFSVGCVGCTFSNGLWTLVFWRFVTGMGIGAEIAIVSTYIGELAPASMRGRYTGIANMFSFIGLAFVPILALWLVPNFSWGWRGMFAVGALGVLTLFALPFLPESPRWLLSKGRFDKARAEIEAAEAVALARGGPLAPVVVASAETKEAGLPMMQLFRPPYLNRLGLLFAVWFLFYVGEYIWLGLGPVFFVDRGFTLTHSIMFMLMSSLGLTLGAALSAWLGDRFERKRSILVGMLVWAVGFAGIAFVASPVAIYALVFMVTVALGFVIPLMYTLTNESFPTGGRASGVSLTDGLGHLGGAAGPIMATSLYAALGAASGFPGVFLLVAASGAIAALLMPFTVSATRRAIGASGT
jgi:putative MFS transporter